MACLSGRARPGELESLETVTVYQEAPGRRAFRLTPLEGEL